jgi:predicted permease
VSPGFQAEDVATARLSLPPNRYQEDSQRRNFIATMLEKVRSIPGVKHSGITSSLPFSGNLSANAIMIAGRELSAGESPPTPGSNTIDSGYLQAMRIPLLAGRNFSDNDGPDSPRVALVDQFMARKYWPNGDAIDAKINAVGSNAMFTVIGIVGSVKTGDLAEQNPVGQVYFHYLQTVPIDMHVVLRRETDKISLTNALRRELAQIDPELALFDVKTMPERMSKSLLNRQAAMVVCLAFAALALLLSAIGIYGVLAYNVAQRTHEIGVRMALGATAQHVVRMILGQSVTMTGIGLTIGVVGALFLTRAMSALLYEVKPHDPPVFLLTVTLLAAVAMAASLIPSWRAVRIQPSTALRQE